MANVNLTEYIDSDPEEEYFPTPLRTPAIPAGVRDPDTRPALPPRRQVTVSEDYFQLRPGPPEGRPRSRSPPVLLPISPFHLADDVEQVRLRAFHGITPSKVSRPLDLRSDARQEGRSLSAPIELQVDRMPDSMLQQVNRMPDNMFHQVNRMPYDRMHSQVNRMPEDSILLQDISAKADIKIGRAHV